MLRVSYPLLRGGLSTRIRGALGWVKKEDGAAAPAGEVVIAEEEGGRELAQRPRFVRLRRRSWARLIRKVWLDDPELCPRGKKPMKVLAAISSPAQDDVIERILRARGEWPPVSRYAPLRASLLLRPAGRSALQA